MVETIKTATAVEEGKERGVIMEATRAKTNIGNPQGQRRARNGCKEGGEKPAQCRRVGISDFSGVVTSMRNAAECRG